MRILCTGDVHIGRRPSRLPAHVDGRPFSCAAAWGRVVELALRERVDLVAVSGDLVDRENRFYEAAGPVEQGVRRLAHAGIVTVLVAGNHDHDVLPWLAQGLGPEVRLLGAGGRWERFTLERNGEALHVDGWSFPEGRVAASPLASYPRRAPDGVPVLGLLHADLDQPASPYAPVALAELRARAASLWLLGHVHAPRLLEAPGSPAVLYPGSPQAMDPGEPGAHGAWLAETGPGGRVSLRMVPLSAVRYETVEVDVDGVAEAGEVDARVVEAVRARLRSAAGESEALRWLSCRLRLVGRTPLHRGLEARLEELCGELELEHGEARAAVESVEARTAPARDLERTGRGSDAPAVLVRLVRDLEEGDGAGHDALLRRAERAVAEVRRARPYLSLVRDDEPEPDVAGTVREQAERLLDALLAQKEAGG